MHMDDSFTEAVNELNIVNPLVSKMAGIKVKAKRVPMIDGFQRLLCRVNVKRDFGWMHFQGKPNTAFGKHIENRVEAVGK